MQVSTHPIVTLVWLGPKGDPFIASVPRPRLPIPHIKQRLVHGVNGKAVSATLCTSHVHANNIMRDLLDKLDPFCRNGFPIAYLNEDINGAPVFAYKFT